MTMIIFDLSEPCFNETHYGFIETALVEMPS
jgi:hypothetical protein